MRPTGLILSKASDCYWPEVPAKFENKRARCVDVVCDDDDASAGSEQHPALVSAHTLTTITVTAQYTRRALDPDCRALGIPMAHIMLMFSEKAYLANLLGG